MIKTVHINKSNEATFICPNCIKSITVDVSKYTRCNNRTKVKSKCICGCSWTSILERRKRYRMAVDIPCICSQVWAWSASEGRAMKVVDLSSSGVKIKPYLNRTIETSDQFFDNPILLAFHLKDKDETHIQKKVYARHICENYIGAEFDDSGQEDPIIGSYILSQRHHQTIM
jgi:hypothetical protein